MGMAFWACGDEPHALASLQDALETNSSFSPAWNGLGALHLAAQRMRQAEPCFRNAAILEPNNPDPYFNLGKLLFSERRLEAAEEAFRKAHDLAPDRVEPLLGLSRTHYLAGRIEDALAVAEQACHIAPCDTFAETSRLLMHNYRCWLSVEALRKDHMALGRDLSARAAKQYQGPPPALDKHGGRAGGDRIRVGYLAANWHNHATLQCSMLALEAHDHHQVEVTFYHVGEIVDSYTKRLKATADHWRDCRGFNPIKVVQLIRQDSLDILVAQEGYFQSAVIEVMAHRMAPIQVSSTGYPHSWGLPTVDYRFTDLIQDPVEWDALPRFERLAALPWFRGFLPPDPSPDPGPPPALSLGYPTFASFNNLAKISDSCLGLWARIMAALPTARLIITQVEEGACRTTFSERAAKNGMDLSRIRFLPRLAEEAFLKLHLEADIHLDSTPYPGVTIAATALWMGLPSVCLNRNWAASREGASQVTAAGFPELIVEDPDAYVAMNVRLAQDLEGLARFRAHARTRMAASPLLDGKGLARNMEAAYKTMMSERAAASNH